MAWKLPPWLPPHGPNAPLFGALEAALPLGAPEAPWQALDLRTATGVWLDLHGELYGIPRLPEEEDEAYRARILGAFLPRNTLEAIQKALRTAYGDAEVVEFPEGYARTYWEFPVADGVLDAGADFWPDAPQDPGAARIRVFIRGRPLPPRAKDPVLEVVRSAGVLPDVVFPLRGAALGARHTLTPWGFTGAHAGEAREADAYLAYLYLPAQLGWVSRMQGVTGGVVVADGSVDAGGSARAGG